MITISPYNNDHYENLIRLHESNGSKLGETPETLPQIGYIATEDGNVVAIGFLRHVEGNMALLDTLVTNAECSSKMRHLGISAVVDALISMAKQLELRYFMAFTVDDGIIKRAFDLGFVITNQRLIVLNLSTDPK